MRTPFLRSTGSIVCFTLLLFTLNSCSLLPDNDWNPRKNPGSKKTLDELNSILEKFALTEKNKDAEGHRQLFASDSSKLNFVLMNYGSPFVFSFTRDQWIGFFTNWDYDYYVDYSGIKFNVQPGIAVDKHHFQGYKNGNPDISGTDLFMFVDTKGGWKVLNISSTILNPDDSTEYDSLNLVSTKPVEVIMSFETAINNRNKVMFENSFLSRTSPCFRFINKIKEYDASEHSAEAFFSAIPVESSELKISLERLNIDIDDQLLAVASSDYSIKKGTKIIEKGKMLATLVAAPNQGWKISAMGFSVTKQYNH